MAENSIANEWKTYLAATYPGQVIPPEPMEQLEMAFFGGMLVMQRMMLHATEGTSEGDAVAKVKAYQVELREWMTNFKKRNGLR